MPTRATPFVLKILMLVLSWNVRFSRPGDLIAKIQSVQPDIVTVQEIKVRFAADWAAHLCDIGLRHQYWSGKDGWCGKDVPDNWYQCLIASR